MTIARGTTPTVSFKFSKFNVENTSTAILKMKQSGTLKIEKNLSTAVVNIADNKLSWKLTQEETLSLAKKKVTITCDWVLLDGTRGMSKKRIEDVEDSGTDEVIT